MADEIRRAHRIQSAYLWLLSVVIFVAGLLLAAGGIWLLSLGGSWYYALAGLGLVVTGTLLFRGQIMGLWLYLAIFLLTIAWALWERGLDLWAQIPRLGAPTVLLLLLFFALPLLRRLARRDGGAAAHGAAVMALAVVGAGLFALFQALPYPHTVLAQAAPDRSASPGNTPIPEVPSREPAARAAEHALAAGADWPAYGGTDHAMRYSPLDQITPANVADLEQVWEYRTGDLPENPEEQGYSPENTPLKVGDMIFVCSAMGIAIGLDAATGKEEWRFDPEVSFDAIPYGATCRGVAYYAVPDAGADALCATRILWATLDARLLAVDARSGQPCPQFGIDGQVNLEDGIGDTVPGWYAVTSAPTIVRGVAVIGAQVKDGQDEDAPSGVVRGYDAVTGDLVWAWDLGNPELTGLPPEGAVYTRGTPNMWTTASGDEELGLVFLPLGNSSVDYYGSNRSARENEYATSLVALDAATGRPVWHFQTVHHDVWDYDLGSQATLVDFPTGAGSVPALILPSKQGDIYVLDRRTGEPLVPYEEREVPQGGVEPEYLSPTQPFSTFHTLARRNLTEADMWGITPFDQLWCRIQFRQAAYDGIYTPPTTDRHWIQYPGYNGGSDWGGVAFDPVRGLIIANYNDMPNYNRLVPREEADASGLAPIYAPGGGEETPLGEAGPQIGAPYAIQVNAGWRQLTGLLCKQPPYGGIRAIELATGRTVWDKPFGTARKNGPFGIPSMLPFDIGTPNNGGAVVTAGGLIFIAAATDDLFRAIDIKTGNTVWQTELPAGGQANPFVFEVNGKQHVGIMAGGHHFMETPIGDFVLVWALP
ncbi:MAG TPA: membrane-bound PQQ-dependent dehydrogenase, glucose/quinate/shikimate family [Alphaproteobacteria bacterium]|nr:membrane-bound PQQ-dependent dehydrogenase, glucose/quinate/shikimate family [Alphaproteobacteria bacterium]